MDSLPEQIQSPPTPSTGDEGTEFGFNRILPPPSNRRSKVTVVPFEEAIVAHAEERRKGMRIFRLLALSLTVIAFSALIMVGRNYVVFSLPNSRSTPAAVARPLVPEERERILAENMMLKHELLKAEQAVRDLEAQLSTQAESYRQALAHLTAEMQASREADRAAAKDLSESAQAEPLQAPPDRASPPETMPMGWDYLQQPPFRRLW